MNQVLGVEHALISVTTGRCCKHFSEIITPWIFSSVRTRSEPCCNLLIASQLQVCFRRQSLQNLLSISQTPHLSCHVVHLTYNGMVHHEVDYDTWLRRVQPRDNSVPPPHSESLETATEQVIVEPWMSYTTAELTTAYDSFIDSVWDEQSLELGYLSFPLLTTSLTRLPNLRCLTVYTNNIRNSGAITWYENWNCLGRRFAFDALPASLLVKPGSLQRNIPLLESHETELELTQRQVSSVFSVSIVISYFHRYGSLGY